MAKIKIGADELILWLRKNGKAKDTPNDEVQGLGRRIHDLIIYDFNGQKGEIMPAYWANFIDDKNIDKFNLPKTSTQYEIDTSHLEALFIKLNTW